ncbi:hypothetical protein FM038_017630 [Shewanella eurypsychrophilus]|uniref:Outer membrane protein beta-barrel domain-containing protein n=1 Tax=Shewanella eurypsychrophilus TaxID=2593656 RepID=A0ABX8S6F8_9GAMM|nr:MULTISPECIES: outer membrane beta-barrel protein [Shewanella]QFU23808.1 hypothetical protein FS418_19405 [Shewanella sp. YLB-09]QXP44884.1 hypothetical protein FM038_017630 [Shewanella eurypsychrophilus]
MHFITQFSQAWVALLVTMALVLSPIAIADESRLKISVGGFYSTSDSGMDVTSPLTDKEFELDFETDLELVESEFLPFIEIAYWFNDQHGIYFDWKRLHRDATNKNITVPYEFEHPDPDIDETYSIQLGAEITTTFNVDIARIGYGYDFYTDDRWDLIFTAGLHVMWLELGFEGEIGACLDETCGIIDIDPDSVVFTDVTAPLPDLGLLAHYQFADSWSITGHAQYFYIKIDNIKGELIDLSGGIEYNFEGKFAADLSYKYYKVTADIDGDYTTTSIHYGFHGPMLTLSYEF